VDVIFQLNRDLHTAMRHGNKQHLYRGSFCGLQIERSDEFNRLVKDFIEST
jgi:hypothetical protein